MQISVSGFHEFSQFNLLKSQLQSRLKDKALLEERKMMRGKAIFALKTNRSLNEIKQMISGVGGQGMVVEVEMR